ncbi:proteasome activator pa28 [Mycena floridula]|nr:proteasome activator pa28 [Mycena floridula]
MDKNLAMRLEEYTNAVRKAGEDTIFNKFPEKILELHDLLSSSSSPLATIPPLSDSTVYPTSSGKEEDEPQSKKRKLDLCDDTRTSSEARYTNRVVANQHILELEKLVKKESELLGSLTDNVKLWITLTMPKIEDGDNFGVQIQEEVLAELHRAQDSAYNIRDTSRQSHLARAKICSKLIKYPHVEDYTVALIEHDEKQIFFARQHIQDIRNIYATLTDLIHKNIAKIRAPKANNSRAMY